MNLHIGDPCVFCDVAHDLVQSGECPRNMIKEPRLKELLANPREALILKTEARLLISAYCLLREVSSVKPPSIMLRHRCQNDTPIRYAIIPRDSKFMGGCSIGAGRGDREDDKD